MLKKLYIHNFKSFWNSSFEFGKVNCLIAPNNTGKSNLLEAIEFIDNLLFPNQNDNINIKFKDLKNFRHDEDNILFELNFELKQRVLIYYDLFDYKYDVKFYINIGEISNIDVHIEGYIKSIKISSTDNKDLASQALGIRVYDEKLEESISNY